jgi:hypothetical protein
MTEQLRGLLNKSNEKNIIEMIFYAQCISANRYKYNYGRQANKTLKDIMIPMEMPQILQEKLAQKQEYVFTVVQNYLNRSLQEKRK